MRVARGDVERHLFTLDLTVFETRNSGSRNYSSLKLIPVFDDPQRKGRMKYWPRKVALLIFRLMNQFIIAESRWSNGKCFLSNICDGFEMLSSSVRLTLLWIYQRSQTCPSWGFLEPNHWSVMHKVVFRRLLNIYRSIRKVLVKTENRDYDCASLVLQNEIIPIIRSKLTWKSKKKWMNE